MISSSVSPLITAVQSNHASLHVNLLILELVIVIIDAQNGSDIEYIFNCQKERNKQREKKNSLSLYNSLIIIGQFTIMPIVPNGAPPGPVIHPSFAKPRTSNSPVSLDS